MEKRALQLTAILLVVLCLAAAAEARGWTIKYDLWFKRWGDYYMAGHDWRWWKAQGIRESGLNPRAVSHAGAQGLMQFMPATAKEMGLRDPFDPEASIQKGIAYDRKIYRYVGSWGTNLRTAEKRKATFAAYNWGPGRVRRLYERKGQPAAWVDMEAGVPQETRAYVAAIQRIYKRLTLG